MFDSSVVQGLDVDKLGDVGPFPEGRPYFHYDFTPVSWGREDRTLHIHGVPDYRGNISRNPYGVEVVVVVGVVVVVVVVRVVLVVVIIVMLVVGVFLV